MSRRGPESGKADGTQTSGGLRGWRLWTARIIVLGLLAFGVTYFVLEDRENARVSAEQAAGPEPTKTYNNDFSEPSISDEYTGTGEVAFLGQTRSDVTQAQDVTDNDLIQLGHNICDGLSSSQDFYETSFQLSEDWEYTTGETLDPTDASSLVGAAIASFCPDSSDLLQ